MLHWVKYFGVISGLAILVAACSDGGSKNATNPTTPPATDASAKVTTNASSGQKPVVEASVIIPGVKSTSEVTFKTPPPNALYGFCDAVNDSGTLTHNVKKTDAVKLSGWAIIGDKGKPADRVIITLPDNQVVAVAPVNLARPDVVNTIKNPALKTSGWVTTFKGSTLPTGKVILKAYAYDTATKTATQLRNNQELTVSE